MLQNLFHLDVSVAEKILRPILVYLFLVLVLRLFGKRELASLNPFDFVVLLMLSNTVQNAIIGNDNSLSGGLIGAVSLLVVNYVVVLMTFKSKRLELIVEGKPAVLVENGQIQHDALKRELLTEGELTTLVHRQGFDGLSEVERCTLEPGGTFSIERKRPSDDEIRHQELLLTIAELSRQVQALTAKVN